MASIKKLRIGSTEYDIGGSSDINVTVQSVTHQTLTVDVIYPTGITAGSKVNVGAPTLKIALTEAPGYSTGSITINGNDTGKTTYLMSAAADGTIIGATDATLLDKKPLIFSMVDSYVKGEDEATPTVSINSGVFTGDLYCSHENDQKKAKKMEAGKNYDIVPPLYVWGGEKSNQTLLSTPNSPFFQFSTKGVKLSGNISSLYSFSDTFYDNTLRLGGAFMNCSQIVDASELDFSDLNGLEGYYPFSYFFSNCINLISPPKSLPGLNATSAYQKMFSGCVLLTKAPELPATTLANSCYSLMFSNCTSLTEAPELPATVLGERCYADMFNGCTSLTEAPELPATVLGERCYADMFNGCTSLMEAPKLPATTLKDYCYYEMFKDCKSIVAAPELPATTLANSCYSLMFSNCTSLTEAPELPATTLANSCYSLMFSNCTSLMEAPELPATTLANSCYSQMFSNCTSLMGAPRLPATTLANSCYSQMFYGCKSLANNVELPAETLASNCCTYMFSGCSDFSYIEIMAKNGVNDTNLHSWLRYVSATGTFVKAAGVEFPSGDSGIPSGWAVEEV